MSTLEEIQKRVDDLQREWASDDASQTAALRAPYGSTVLPEMDLSEKPMVLPEMDLSAPPESDPGPKDVGPGASSSPEIAAAPPSPRMPQATPALGARTNPAPVVGSAPDWEKLQRDLQAAEGRAGTQRTIQQAFATVSPNHAFHADPNAGSEDIAAAKAPLEIAQARQGLERGQAAMGAEKRKEDLQAAEMDPNSPQSQRARGALKGFFGDTKLLPPDFDTYSAADVSKFSTTLVPLAKDQSEERRAASKEKAVADTKAASLEDRKKLMTSQYVDDPKSSLGPDEKASLKSQIAGLRDLGDAQSFQQALEGRLGRESTQTHQDEAQKSAFQHSEELAQAARQETFKREVALAKMRHQLEIGDAKMPPEMAQKFGQAQGMGQSIDQLEAGLKDLNTPAKRAAAQFLMASKGGTASALAARAYAQFDPETVAAAQRFVALNNNVGTQLAHSFDGLGARPATVENAMHNLASPANTPSSDSQIFTDLRTTANNLLDQQLTAAKAAGIHLGSVPAPIKGPPAAGEGAPAAGTVTILDKKSRRSRNVSPEKAKAILAAPGGEGFEIVGAPHQ